MNRKYFELIAFVVITTLIVLRFFYQAVPSYVPFAAVGGYFFLKYVILKNPEDEEK